MEPEFTISGAERVEACPASAAFSRVFTTDEDANRGTSLHAHCRRVVEGVSVEASAALVPLKWRETARNIDFKRAVGGLQEKRAEVAYAWNLRSGAVRELGVGLDRKYIVEDDEIPGTVDLEGVRFDGMPVVGDFKMGFEPVSLCEVNPQPLFFGRVRAALTGASQVEGRIIYVRETGRVHIDSKVFTRFDLDAFEDRMVSISDRVREARGAFARGEALDVRPGDHCRYCPSISTCPAHTALARAMMPELDTIEARMQQMTPVQGGAAWRKLDAIKAVVSRVEDGLKALAEHTPLPLGDGLEVRATTYDVDQFHKDQAIALLRELGATPAQIASCSTPTTRKQVRALKVLR